MKKLLSIFLIFISIIACSACGKTNNDTQISDNTDIPNIQIIEQNTEIRKPISAKETVLMLSSINKADACEYLQQNYTEPFEKARLLTQEASDGMNLDQKYIFYYFVSAVSDNIDYYKENYPAGSENNTVCVPAEEVEEYLSLFIEDIGNILLRSEHNGYYNKEQNGYEYFVGETSWIIDNTQVFDYYIDKEKLIINYYILPIDTEDKIPMTVVFHKNGDYYKYYRTLSLSGIYTKAAEKDGYAISLENNGFSGELSQATLINTSTGETNLLDIFSYHNSDVGFFKNGDIYVMDDYGMNVYNPQINMTDKTPIFTTDTNFPCGKDIYPDGTDRYLFAIRRDPEKMDYIVIYGEYINKENYEDNYVSDLQMVHTYKIGLLDKEGNLTKSWDTGVNIMFSRGFDDVFMIKPSENEIEFFVKFKDEERLRGRFNLESGEYTPIKEFKNFTQSENNVVTSEKISYSAEIIAERLVNSMVTNSVPESPEFNKTFFLFAVADKEYQNDKFIYNNAFPYAENGFDTVFDFATCEKVIQQVYGDSRWKAEDSFSENFIQGDKAVQSTDIGWGVLYYGLNDDREIIVSEDGTQLTVRAEMVGPGDTSKDPEIISWGVYDVVFDIMTENGEQFLRFNKFNKV